MKAKGCQGCCLPLAQTLTAWDTWFWPPLLPWALTKDLRLEADRTYWVLNDPLSLHLIFLHLVSLPCPQPSFILSSSTLQTPCPHNMGLCLPQSLLSRSQAGMELGGWVGEALWHIELQVGFYHSARGFTFPRGFPNFLLGHRKCTHCVCSSACSGWSGGCGVRGVCVHACVCNRCVFRPE